MDKPERWQLWALVGEVALLVVLLIVLLGRKKGSQMDKLGRWLPWALLCGFAVLLMGSLFALAAWVHGYGLTNEISLPLLAIAGVIALLGALALVAIGFALMSMSDKTQALGLPSGSVRAVIALSLVVLFAILTVFLFSSLRTDGQVREEPCLAI